ncbi:uncharacterized protein VTP21DRAFT_4503 [Calcarisporiella thermophila]|uniref:uncharacterized protein n=1 Tax=Calcarisporiella thermophila TaxID=911321 RepID=UPI0037440DE5
MSRHRRSTIPTYLPPCILSIIFLAFLLPLVSPQAPSPNKIPPPSKQALPLVEDIVSERKSADGLSIIQATLNGTTIVTPVQNTTGLVEIKVGLLLPYSYKQDNLTVKLAQSGTSAIRLAVNEINQQKLIPGAYITLIEKDSFPIDPNNNNNGQSGAAASIFAAVDLLQKDVVGVIGDLSSSLTQHTALLTSRLAIPQCSFSAWTNRLSNKQEYPYFFRTIPTSMLFTEVMMRFIASQGWRRFGVLYSSETLDQQLSEKVTQRARELQLDPVAMQPFDLDSSEKQLETPLLELREAGVRVFMIASVPDSRLRILRLASKLGLFSPEYAWLMIDDGQTFPENDTEFNAPFNGLFLFDSLLKLDGYPPYEAFLDKWAALDPREYPFAGQRDIGSNEGLAYSCMMVMARGFANAIRNSVSATVTQAQALQLLARGRMGDKLLPPAFNTGYVGPEGPITINENGDLAQGNFMIFNIQRGTVVPVAKFVFGNLSIVNAPMYIGDRMQPPSDIPPVIPMNPRFGSPGGIAILSVSSAGILFALVMMFLVISFRKSEVFKASSPLFCCLELLGFMLSFVGVILWVDIPNDTVCALRPVALNAGFVLVLSNIVAKNFRVYRIFNNVFVERTVIRDGQLVKIAGAICAGDMLLVVLYLLVTPPRPHVTNFSFTSQYYDCVSDGPYLVFWVLLFVYNGTLILYATFLAFQTRDVASNYNECRQISFSV